MILFKERENLDDLQVNSQGRKLFFPWGALGSGFILESKEQEKDVLEFLKKEENYFRLLYWLSILYFFYYDYKIRKLTKNLQRSNEKFHSSRRYKKILDSKSLSHFVIVELFSFACLIFICLFMFKRSKDIIDIFVNTFYLVFVLYVIILNAYMIYLKIKKK